MTEPASSYEKFPAEIKIVRVMDSPIGPEVALYFVTGVMSGEQRDTLKESLPMQAEFPIEGGRFVVSGLVSHTQLVHARDVFTPRAKSWRGAYYVITNRFVQACEEAMDQPDR